MTIAVYRCFLCKKELSSEEAYDQARHTPPGQAGYCNEHKTIVEFVNTLHGTQRRAGYLAGSTINLNVAQLSEEEKRHIETEIDFLMGLIVNNVSLFLQTIRRVETKES